MEKQEASRKKIHEEQKKMNANQFAKAKKYAEKEKKEKESAEKKVGDVTQKMKDFSMTTYGVQEAIITNPDDLVQFNCKTGKAEVVGKDPRKNKDHI